MQIRSSCPFLTVPGLSGSGSEHWHTAWERLLPASRVEQKDWDAPRYAIWADALGRAVQRSPRPPVLVAHSLGCILVSRWLAEAPRASVAGAFLAAPVDVDRLAGDPRFDIQGFDPVVTTRLPCSTAVVASRTDEYVDFARAEYFARCWGSAFLDAGHLGHMGDAARLGDWPAGLGFLEKFVATLHA